MASDLSSFKVAVGEIATAAKQNNLIQKIQDTLNGIGDTSLMSFFGTAFLDASAIKQGTATAGQVLGFNGTIWAPSTSADVYYRKVTEKDVVNTTTKTDLLNGEVSVAANALSANGTVRIKAGGDYLNNSGSSRTIVLELKLGSQVLWDSGASDAIGAATTRRAWMFDATIQALASTSAQRASGTFVMSHKDAPTTGTGVIRDPTANLSVFGSFLSAATTVDVTSGQTLTFSVTHSAANASLSMRLEHASVQVTA